MYCTNQTHTRYVLIMWTKWLYICWLLLTATDKRYVKNIPQCTACPLHLPAHCPPNDWSFESLKNKQTLIYYRFTLCLHLHRLQPSPAARLPSLSPVLHHLSPSPSFHQPASSSKPSKASEDKFTAAHRKSAIDVDESRKSCTWCLFVETFIVAAWR